MAHVARQQAARARVSMPSGFARFFSRDLEKFGAPMEVDDLRSHDLTAYGQPLSDESYAKWLVARGAGARAVLQIDEVTEMIPAALLACAWATARRN